jgi:hypothetical protein
MCEISVAAHRKQAKKHTLASRFHRVALGHIQALASRKTTETAASRAGVAIIVDFFNPGWNLKA